MTEKEKRILDRAARKVAERVEEIGNDALEGLTSGPCPAINVEESEIDQVENEFFGMIASYLA